MPQYNEKFIVALQWMWGDGYLSPGGPEEVAEMLRDVSLTGREVLDVGSGLGAIAVTLVQDYGASRVAGVDVEAHLVEQANNRAARSGLGARITHQLVEPGPLPFAEGSFDAVFTKDAIVHIPDKAAFYTEVLRVLRPGGLFVGSDWLCGGPETHTDTAREWLELVHLNFQMKDLAHTQQALEASGFHDVRMVDRNEWYRAEIDKELASLQGERFDQLAEMIGQDEADYRRISSEKKRDVIESGFLRPTHFVGTRRD